MFRDEEDLAQECNAYMKIKYFMAKRIAELEANYGSLQKDYALQVGRNLELLDWFKSIETTIRDLRSEKIEKKENSFNLSKDSIESIYIFEKGAESQSNQSNQSKEFVDCGEENSKTKTKCEKMMMNITQEQKQNLNHPFYIVNDDVLTQENERNDIQKIEDLKNENLELYKENLKLKNEINMRNFKVSKLTTEKLLLINELKELLNSLDKVDQKTLHNFFKENKIKKNQKNIYNKYNHLDIPSSLGIKYNILSTYSVIGTIISKVEENKSLPDSKYDFTDVDLNKCKNIFKNFEKDFERMLNKNLKKKRILYESDSD